MTDTVRRAQRVRPAWRPIGVLIARAAERMTGLLEQANALLESERWDQQITLMARPAAEIVDRAFWRGVILIALLIAGLSLLRWIPRRNAGARDEMPKRG